MDKNKLVLPISILLGCIILGGLFYATQVIKQKSIEKQQLIELRIKAAQDQAKTEQDKKEYIVKRKQDCYDLETSERKKWNNVKSSFYREKDDICVVEYTTDKYKGVDCWTKYKDDINTLGNCIDGTFTKEF